MIPFNWWRPDIGGPNAGFSPRIEGVIPQSNGYGPFPQFVQADGAGALTGEPRGTISVQLEDGSWQFYAATEETIDVMASDFTFSSIETGRSLADGEDVSFAYFYGKLINTDSADGMKAYDTESPGTNDAISGAPSARAVFPSNDVLVALGDTNYPRQIKCSDRGNYAKWSGGAVLTFNFPDGGACVGGADLRNKLAIVLQESKVRILQFGAGPSTFLPTAIADGRGCVAERTIIAFNGRAFWWDTDGPWLFSEGDGLVPIGAEKINRWALANIGRDNFPNLQGTVDPGRNIVMWRIDSSRVLAFNWVVKEFSILPVTTTALSRIATPAIAISSLSGTISALDGAIADFGGGAAPVLGGLNLNLKYCSFSGANMAAAMETGVVTNNTSQMVSRLMPVDDASGGTVQVGVSDRPDVALTWKTGEGRRDSGRVPVRARGKYQAYRRNIPAGEMWTYASGIEQGGGR